MTPAWGNCTRRGAGEASRWAGSGDWFAGAVGSAAAVAGQALAEAVVGALGEQFEHEIVDAQGHGDVVSRAGVHGGCGARQLGDVVGPVLAGAEEVGDDDNFARAPADAGGVGCGDGGFAQLHVGWFDDGVAIGEALGEGSGDGFEHLVGGVEARSVVDDDDSRRLHGVECVAAGSDPRQPVDCTRLI